MSERILPIRLGPMKQSDVGQVVAIDRLSFPLPWSAASYRRELAENENSHFIVAYMPPGEVDGGHWWSRWRRLPPARPILGYAGYWHVAGEAHVSTIAVHPDFRQQKVGERLLAGLLRHAMDLGATLSTLEVRVSNTGAQHMYFNFGYETVGRRKAYYRDNREDALLMTLEPITKAAPYIERWEALYIPEHSISLTGGTAR